MFDGRKLNDFREIMNFLPDTLKASYSYSSIWAVKVIMAGERVDILSVKESKTVAYLLDVIN